MTGTEGPSREPDIFGTSDLARDEEDASIEELQAMAVRLREQLVYGSQAPGIEVDGGHVIDHGQIEDMALPNGWLQSAPHRFAGGVGTQSLYEFHPADAPPAKLCFYYRGLPESEEVGQKFRAVLDQEPHHLSGEEMKSLDEVLDDKAGAEAFTPFVARTENWNGKRILIVEGRYVKIGEDAMEIFVDAGGDGRLIQEIFFQAPRDLYEKYWTEAKKSMQSIEWK
jgi:hypothetical protein